MAQEICGWCKVCVAIFVSLSGYDLTVKAKKMEGEKYTSFLLVSFCKTIFVSFVIGMALCKYKNNID